MSDDLTNENNLVQRREDRRTLAKMRSKLATSGQVSAKLDVALPKQRQRSIKIWPFVVGLGAVLFIANVALKSQQKQTAASKMVANGKTSVTLEPPPGLSLDEQSRFWCYATYDFDKLKKSFPVPKGLVLNKVEARKNLDRLLAEDLGAQVRNEIFAYQQAHPDPVVVAKPIPIKKKK